MLTDAALKSLKPKEKIYKIAGRDGMYVRGLDLGICAIRMVANNFDERFDAPFPLEPRLLAMR